MNLYKNEPLDDVKLWMWRLQRTSGEWFLPKKRLSEKEVKEKFKDCVCYNKLEALKGVIRFVDIKREES